MYQCKNCGGNLKFDIASQALHCDYCDSSFSPYDVTKETDAMEGNYYETTVFSCPQCGAELISSDTDATSFCSYCGAANILTSRISHEKRPARIIPFKISKEECKEIYTKQLKHAFFAPKELTDPACIDGFRGIYMPYWSYNLVQKGHLTLEGKKNYRLGDYLYTDSYELEGDVYTDYKGYTFDASSSFFDNVSENLVPFLAKDEKDFTPSYLSGFYADTADIPSEVYEPEIKEHANEITIKNAISDQNFQPYGVNRIEAKAKVKNTLPLDCTSAQQVLYPVWFLSYRKNDRVAYAAINGQTGKLFIDTPIDFKKYGITTAVLALVLFIFLNINFTFKPTTLLFLSAVFAVVTAFVYLREINDIHRRNENLDDKGLQAKLGNSTPETDTHKKSFKKPDFGTLNPVLWFIIIFFIFMFFPLLMGLAIVAVIPLMFAGIVYLCVKGIKMNREISETNGPIGFWSAMISVFLCMIIAFINPVEDLYYYLGAIVSMIGVLITLVNIIKNYNVLATRRLPQFNKQGGDDRA